MDLRTEGDLEDDNGFTVTLFVLGEKEVRWIKLLRVVGNAGDLTL